MRWIHRQTASSPLLWRGVGLAAALLVLLVLLVLLAVFSLYTQPDFFFTLANQVWACF